MSDGVRVDVYLLDWNQHRPSDASDAVARAKAGDYEYSFTVYVREPHPVRAAEYAYALQGNGPMAAKVRVDRQTMSMGDVAMVDGQAYLCVSFGFDHVPELTDLLKPRIEQSWKRWTARPTARDLALADPDELARQMAGVLLAEDAAAHVAEAATDPAVQLKAGDDPASGRG
jgi:hypothetical protein